jgi:hypothetical protein
MDEMEPKDIIQRLETLYQSLMTKDLTPDEEAQSKVQLLEILSSIKAHSEIQGGEKAANILEQVKNLKDMLLDWDPYGSAWFKEEKTLVNAVYNLLAAVKTLLLEKVTASEDDGLSAIKGKIGEIEASLRNELTSLKNEVATIKKSVISLATAMKEKFDSMKNSNSGNKSPQQIPNQKPVPLSVTSAKPEPVAVNSGAPLPKPVPIPTPSARERETPKPISLPKPVPIPIDDVKEEPAPQPFRRERQSTISIPKPEPEPIPLDGPVPIPLDGPSFEEPEPLDAVSGKSESNGNFLGAIASAKKEKAKKPGKEELFSIFSSGSGGASSQHELEIVEDSGPAASSPSIQLSPSNQQSMVSEGDAETLYQELISLEGKRYSIERGIRDLKTDRENGAISDHEYKEKLSQELNKLQNISKRIGEIREKLD